MADWKAIVFGLLLAAIVPFASASCWDIQYMPSGWTWSAWICNSSQVVGYWCNMYGQSGPFSMMLHGQIETAAPSGHPQYGNVFRVYLQGFNYASPYPATLKCYKRMGVSGNYWWMYTGLQTTLNAGQSTPDSSPWVQYGCPPVKNLSQQGGSPPQVQIQVNWNGWPGMMGSGGKLVSTVKRSRR